MGLPVSLPAYVIDNYVNCTLATVNTYPIHNCTWLWSANAPEIAYAYKTTASKYLVMTPAQFDSTYPAPSQTSSVVTTTTSSYLPPEGTPLEWLKDMGDDDWEWMVENDGWEQAEVERVRARLRHE